MSCRKEMVKDLPSKEGKVKVFGKDKKSKV